MSDLADLAEQYSRNATAWEAGHPYLSGEVCARHAEDWDALHTLAVHSGAFVESIAALRWPMRAVLSVEEEAVAACRRLAAHLKEPGSLRVGTPDEQRKDLTNDA